MRDKGIWFNKLIVNIHANAVDGFSADYLRCLELSQLRRGAGNTKINSFRLIQVSSIRSNFFGRGSFPAVYIAFEISERSQRRTNIWVYTSWILDVTILLLKGKALKFKENDTYRVRYQLPRYPGQVGQSRTTSIVLVQAWFTFCFHTSSSR